jgi:hypothetical protein
MEYRKHLQAFIDRWRYNANRGMPLLVYLFHLTPDGLCASRPGSVKDQNSGEGDCFWQVKSYTGTYSVWFYAAARVTAT